MHVILCLVALTTQAVVPAVLVSRPAQHFFPSLLHVSRLTHSPRQRTPPQISPSSTSIDPSFQTSLYFSFVFLSHHCYFLIVDFFCANPGIIVDKSWSHRLVIFFSYTPSLTRVLLLSERSLLSPPLVSSSKAISCLTFQFLGHRALPQRVIAAACIELACSQQHQPVLASLQIIRTVLALFVDKKNPPPSEPHQSFSLT